LFTLARRILADPVGANVAGGVESPFPAKITVVNDSACALEIRLRRDEWLALS
jgi:hypothetical protein